VLSLIIITPVTDNEMLAQYGTNILLNAMLGDLPGLARAALAAGAEAEAPRARRPDGRWGKGMPSG
jgi:hypothetical protein